MKNKIVVIGCGNVGMSYVFSLVHQDFLIDEIVLIDVDEKKVSGEVLDLEGTLVLGYPKKIRFGDYSDCVDAKMVCITAGVNQKKGQSRLDLIKENCVVFSSILSSLMKYDFKGIFLIAANPLDVMSYYTYSYTKVSPSRIIGSGIFLDTIRFCSLLGNKLGINPKNICIPVFGEHGDSSFIPFESFKVNGKKLSTILTEEQRKEITEKVHKIAYEIIEKKGFTEYGVAMCLCRITKAVFLDEKVLLPLSVYSKEEDIFIGKLAYVGKEGVLECKKLSFSSEEQKDWEFSVSKIKEGIKQIFE